MAADPANSPSSGTSSKSSTRSDDLSDSAALLLFNEAVSLFEKRVKPTVDVPAVGRVCCLRWETTNTGGYATLKEAGELLKPVEDLLGVAASEWPQPLEVGHHREICRDAADRAWRMIHDAPDEVAHEPVLRMKINDRVLNRMEPMWRVERVLEHAIGERGLRQIWTPWRAARYRTVERPGMLRLNSPGHRIAAMLDRLQQKYNVAVHSLWPQRVVREKPKLWVAGAALSTVRAVKLTGRAIRDAVRPFPAGAVHAQGERPRLGFIVGGASPWYHSKPLLEACRDQFEPVVIAHDIFRNPSSYRVLQKSRTPFVPIDSQLSLPRTLSTLAANTVKAARLRRSLDRWRRQSDTLWRTEVAEELKADLQCLPELELYVQQLRAAIRRYDLKAVVSSNVLDSLLSAGGEACRSEGIPKICLQNTTAALIDQPIYADCDLYFAESEAMAQLMRSSGARGDVEAVGLPFYDELLKEAKAGGGALRAQFPELEGKKIISLIAAPSNHDYGPLLDPLLKMIWERDDVGLVIRLHPRSHPTQYQALGNKLRSLGKGGRVQDIPLAGFLADTDYMVATISSTTQSALVIGVRMFCWVPQEWRLYADEANQLRPEIENRWFDPEQVVAALRKALDDPQDDARWHALWRRFVARNMTGVDGRACERIVGRIRRLAA